MVKKKYNEATTVASSRSRLGKKDKPIKTGTAHQREFTNLIKKLFINLDGKLEGEPYANSTIARPNKKK